jgi:hypothetical protein
MDGNFRQFHGDRESLFITRRENILFSDERITMNG